MSRGVTWHVNIVSTILELLGCKWDAERGGIGCQLLCGPSRE